MSADIKMVRGDTKFLTFTRINADNESILEKADAIYFTVKAAPVTVNSEEYVIQKTIEDMDFDEETGKYSFTIEPEDTDELNWTTFKWDLQVNHGGIKKTVASGNLVITPEVTFADNEV